MQVEIGILAMLSGVILGWLGLHLTSKRNLKTDVKEELKDNNNQNIKLAEFKIVLDNIKSTTDETRLDVKEINRKINDMDMRITLVERDVKTAHSRIDSINTKIGGKKEK